MPGCGTFFFRAALVLSIAGVSVRSQAGSATSSVDHVLVVSIDGLLPASYLDPDAHRLAVLTRRLLARTGAVALGARSVFP